MARTIAAELPELGNMTPQGFVDVIGNLRETQKDLKQQEGIYTEAFKARFPDDHKKGVEAEVWSMACIPVTQNRIQTQVVKDLLDRLLTEGKITPEEAKECFGETSFTQMKFTKRPKG